MNPDNIFRFDVRTVSGTGFTDITGEVRALVESSGRVSGIVVVFTPHTTAAITINENADPSVKSDMKAFIQKLVPHENYFDHMEGNSPAHIMSSLISPSETLIMENGKLILGTWQGIFFCEFDGPRTRKVYVKILADK